MAVRIRLLRMGKIRNPQYRIVVADARTKRDGRAIEYVGLYHPKEDPSRIEVNSARVQHWLAVGAQPSEPVIAILSKTGDWQKFKGLPPPAEPLKVAAPRADRKAVYEVEAKAAAGLGETETKPKKAASAAKSTRGKAKASVADDAASASERGGGDQPGTAQPEAETQPAAEAQPAEATATAQPEAEESNDAGADAQA